MKIKKIMGIAAVSILIIVGARLLGYGMAYAKITRDYISVYTDNKEDFEYVAKIMKQWYKYKSIYFDYFDSNMDFDDCVSSSNPEFESEILKNKKFYESLKNIYELNEIRSISVYSNYIAFNFRRHLRGQSDSIVYREDKKMCSCTHKIDKNWAVEMKPNGHHHISDILEEWIDYFKW